MEQKKILLVAISVGVFLVIVIGAAIMVFGSNSSSPAIASPRIIAPGTSGIDVPAQPLYSGQEPEAEETGIPSPPAEEAPQISERVGSAESSTVISVSRPSAAAVPDTPPPTSAPRSTAPSPAPQAARPQTAPAPQAAAPAPQVAPVTQAARPPQATEAARPQTAPVTQAARPQAAPAPQAAISVRSAPGVQNNYWVQTGAFTAMSRAQGVRETLAARGISSIIENRDVNGTTFFRVRVGPYTSRNEADYWLSLIKSINGFENSQIFQTQTTVN